MHETREEVHHSPCCPTLFQAPDHNSVDRPQLLKARIRGKRTAQEQVPPIKALSSSVEGTTEDQEHNLDSMHRASLKRPRRLMQCVRMFQYFSPRALMFVRAKISQEERHSLRVLLKIRQYLVLRPQKAKFPTPPTSAAPRTLDQQQEQQ